MGTTAGLYDVGGRDRKNTTKHPIENEVGNISGKKLFDVSKFQVTVLPENQSAKFRYCALSFLLYFLLESDEIMHCCQRDASRSVLIVL